jgi:hypothetical protein
MRGTEIQRKFEGALAAMKKGNPALNITTFIFDKVVAREAGDDRPLSKVGKWRLGGDEGVWCIRF